MISMTSSEILKFATVNFSLLLLFSRPFLCHSNIINMCHIAGFGHIESNIDHRWQIEAGK